MLAAAGISELDQFQWYEAPSKESLERAHVSLKDLGALDSSCEITELGHQMSRFLASSLCAIADRGQSFRCDARCRIDCGTESGRPFIELHAIPAYGVNRFVRSGSCRC